jgi:metal-responsive CopG/Arc/MetJ family transcriptional regulator
LDGKLVVLKLNQQQLELLDRTVARGAAPDRLALIRRALREYAARHVPPQTGDASGERKT